MFDDLPLHMQAWTPRSYQERAVEWLISRPAAALWADPGTGKTITTLEAFRRLREAGQARRMLVVAPLLPAKEVWPREVRKWANVAHLKMAVLHGQDKQRMLHSSHLEQCDITVTNYESLLWMRKNVFKLPYYDVVVADELTRLKTHTAARSKAFRALFRSAKRRWGLTGTPMPKGYMDIFGQILALDDGEALGRTMTEYRMRYFTPDPHNTFNWLLQPGAEQRIEARLANTVLRIAAEDYLDLPPRIDDVRRLSLPPELAAQYKTFKRDMVLSLPNREITALNAGALCGKLSQFANGAVYHSAGPDDASENVRSFERIHDIKLDALDEMLEELESYQVLIAYEFKSDLARILERHPDIPILSSQMPPSKLKQLITEWNQGKIRRMLIHPASGGHGLNLQESGANHIIWFSPTFNLEYYDQLIARLLRQGTTAKAIFNHLLVLTGTIDEIKLSVLASKADAQTQLLAAYKELADQLADKGDEPMAIRKLGDPRPTDEAQAAAPQRITPQKQATSAWEQDIEEQEYESGSPQHRAAVRTQVTKPGVATSARAAFSPAIQAQLDEALPETEETPAPAETKPAAKPSSEAKPAPKTAAQSKAAEVVETVTELDLSQQEKLAAIVELFRASLEAIVRIK